MAATLESKRKRAEHDAAVARANLQAHHAQLALDLMQRYASTPQLGPHGLPYGFNDPRMTLLENWGDLIPREEYWKFDEPGYGIDRRISGPVAFPYTRRTDRQHGKLYPIYETEHDLARVRGQARNLGAFASLATGAMESLVNYTVGTGIKVTAQHIVEGAEELAQQVQRFIRDWLSRNEVIGEFDREVHNRSREDGEALVVLYPQRDGHSRAELIEPEYLTAPQDPGPLEQFLGVDDSTGERNYWHFGIHTRDNLQMGGCEDLTRPLGYHFVFDGRGSRWDYIPWNRVQHFKRNVPRSAKRGVSDYFCVQADIEREAKLRRNTAEGAAIQAAIALIREPQEAIDSTGISDMLDDIAVSTFKQPVKDSGTRTIQVERFNSGTILNTPSGMKHHAGPLGQLRSPVFIQVGQYVLRSIGIRWSMPEYMISGDASNTNFASTLVAESPFVKARQHDQGYYGRHWKSLIWKAVKFAWLAGRFGNIDWREVQRAVEIHVTSPEVASRDKLKQAQTHQLELGNGTLSRRTAAEEAGRDFDQERRNMANEPPPPAPALNAQSPPVPGAGVLGATAAALESAATPQQAAQIVDRLWEYYP